MISSMFYATVLVAALYWGLSTVVPGIVLLLSFPAGFLLWYVLADIIATQRGY